ncbi:MAG: PEP-CTERM sorting domain-containing protein [Akkermansiaceae bacterium]
MKTIFSSLGLAVFFAGGAFAQSYFDFTSPVSDGDTIKATDGTTSADVGISGGRLTSYAGSQTLWRIGYNWDNNSWSSTAKLTFNTPVSFGSIRLVDFGNADIEVSADSAMSLGSGNLNGYSVSFANSGQTLTLTDGDDSNNTLNQSINFAGAISSLTIEYSTSSTEPLFGNSGSDSSQIIFANGFTTVPEPSSTALLGLGVLGCSLRRKR